MSDFDNLEQVRLKTADNLADLVICAADFAGEAAKDVRPNAQAV